MGFDLARDRVAQAIYDPGSVVGGRRGPSWGVGRPWYDQEQESLWDWQIRAVLHTLRPGGQPDEAVDPPRVQVHDTDRADLVDHDGMLLAALTYEQLLTFQERVGDAVAEMALMPSTTPPKVKRPRKG
jgi:hypothetical protein